MNRRISLNGALQIKTPETTPETKTKRYHVHIGRNRLRFVASNVSVLAESDLPEHDLWNSCTTTLGPGSFIHPWRSRKWRRVEIVVEVDSLINMMAVGDGGHDLTPNHDLAKWQLEDEALTIDGKLIGYIDKVTRLVRLNPMTMLIEMETDSRV